MQIITLDIETIPLPKELRSFTKPKKEDIKCGKMGKEKCEEKFQNALKEWEDGTSAALDDFQCSIPLIGFAIENTDYAFLYNDTHEDEKEMLEKFWDILNRHIKHTIVGFNVFWDFRKIMRRSIINGIQIPLKWVDQINKYNPSQIFDIMRYWQFNDRKHYVKLETLARSLGIEAKTILDKDGNPVEGATFWKTWKHDINSAVEYNKQDVLSTREIYKRIMGIK